MLSTGYCNGMKINSRRIRQLQGSQQCSGPVVYWMSRDQRIGDNWALLYAQQQALKMKSPLLVVFCLVPDFLNAALRHYGFMLRGLEEVASGLANKQISFHLLTGEPGKALPRFLKLNKAGCLITDFDPLRLKQQWKKDISGSISIPFFEVDAHNIVPCWHASEKQEYGAYTLRPKMLKALPEFLDAFPRLRFHPYAPSDRTPGINWHQLLTSLPIERSVGEVDWIVPGERAAKKALRRFLNHGLERYAETRNDPSLDGQSGLSPYLHFGHLSAQRVALEAMKCRVPKLSRDSFLEELIIRRELSDNFCLYAPDYDSVGAFPAWAQKSLHKHRKDRRQYLYSLKQFEQADTHDDLWNAAQRQMVTSGKMHGYLRMYWAKKILEWTVSPEEALDIAVYLNNKYELDGRDPNGYAGIA